MAYSSAYGSDAYASPYGTPSTQGSNGQQGANQTQTPDSTYSPTRAPSWSPAPASSQSQPRQTTQATQALPAASGSPVTPNGQIAPPAPTAQPASGQPTQPTQPEQPQRPPDPFQAMGGGYWTGQQWVPKDHPLAQGQPQQIDPGGFVGQPGQPQNSPYGPYPGRPQDTTYSPTVPAPIAPGAQNFQQYHPLDQSGIQGQQTQLLSQLLANPALSASVVEQMKAKQRESALAMGQQFQNQASQNAASRGTNLDSQLTNTQGDINDQTLQSILGSYRDIDIAAAQSNRQDQLGALSAAEQVLSGQLGRASDQYKLGMSGQQAQADENNRAFGNQMAAAGFADDQNRFASGSNLDAYKTDLGAFFDWQNNLNQQKQLQNQFTLGQGSLNIDKQRLDQDASQFGQTNQLNWAELLNNMAMGRYNYGLDAAALQQRGQEAAMRALGF